MITNISPDSFISETRRWGIGPDSLIRVRMMRKGNLVYCRFSIPNTNEALQTAIPIEKFEEYDFLNLYPIAVPAVFDIEDHTANIEKKLEELNAVTKLAVTDRHQNFGFR